jgi:hypothetical protein
MLECRIALRPEADPTGRALDWTISVAAVSAVVGLGTSWVADGGGTLTDYTGVTWPTPDAARAADAIMLALPPGDYRGGGRLTANSGSRFRCFDTTPWMGYADLTVGTDPTVADFADLVDMLAALAPYATYGFIRPSDAPGLIAATWSWSVGWPDPAAQQPVPGQKRVEQTATPRPFAAQLMRVPTGVTVPADRWEIRPAGELSLVVARDPAPWLAGEADLDQARLDLTGLRGRSACGIFVAMWIALRDHRMASGLRRRLRRGRHGDPVCPAAGVHGGRRARQR